MTDEQFAQIVGLLREIRDVLVFMATPEPDMGCPHEEDQRVPLGRDEFLCKRCKVRFRNGVPIEP